ncbi:MLP-like protein 328 [Ziziphus jujuba]|uniref:MLP-like protein 328 n=1 Tax=Ziziphus jujuba TaxID=326968 RepID=A0ABM3ZXD9_ZIZJJ|nr:MLP-like protein 328 [Ziziphus jujuba]
MAFKLVINIYLFISDRIHNLNDQQQHGSDWYARRRHRSSDTCRQIVHHIQEPILYHIPNISNNIHAVDVHEGDWEKGGSVKEWKYKTDGNVETFKENVEVDEENKAVTFIAVGGHILHHYKNYKATFKLTPKIEGRN